MKNRIKFLAIALLATIFSTFTSCDDDNSVLPVETHEDAYGDVILKKMANGSAQLMLICICGRELLIKFFFEILLLNAVLIIKSKFAIA